MKNKDEQLKFAQERKGYADAAIDKANQQRDEFLTSAVSSFIPSDIRLKENIIRMGISKSGIPIYTFNYKNDDQLWSGAMAQDLLELGIDNAVSTRDGYYTVDYSIIDVDMIAKN